MTTMDTAESNAEPSMRRVRNRKVILRIAGVLLLVALPIGAFRAYQWRYEHARAVWKTAALQRLAGLSATNEAISRELEELKATANITEYHRWAGDQVALMTNGEFIIYAFWHGSNSGFVDHLFLGHCSDGRWLYSTYHFCSHMAGAEIDPPGSINEFAKMYSAREFDGKSDVCLKHTWPLRD
jgi:hypothetical protein